MAWKVRRESSGPSSEVPFQIQGKVGRIEDPPPAVFFKKYVEGNRPVVLSGVMEEWPALERWSWDYLAAVAGDCSGEVIVSKNGLYPDYITQPSPMASVISRARSGLASSSQRRGVMPLVLLLKRSGNISAKSVTTRVRSRSE